MPLGESKLGTTLVSGDRTSVFRFGGRRDGRFLTGAGVHLWSEIDQRTPALEYTKARFQEVMAWTASPRSSISTS
jgi:hypothetical protein